MLLGLLCGLVAFEHLLDQVNTASRSIQFIAKQLIGRARGVAETTVHTTAQDAFGFQGAGQLACFVAQGGLHGSTLRVQATGVEDAPWIELLFQIAVVAHQHIGQGLKRTVDQAVPIAGRMPADFCHDVANERLIGI